MKHALFNGKKSTRLNDIQVIHARPNQAYLCEAKYLDKLELWPHKFSCFSDALKILLRMTLDRHYYLFYALLTVRTLTNLRIMPNEFNHHKVNNNLYAQRRRFP
jgi:hypothetical protein